MGHHQFDNLTRILATTTSRRQALKAFIIAATGGMLASISNNASGPPTATAQAVPGQKSFLPLVMASGVEICPTVLHCSENYRTPCGTPAKPAPHDYCSCHKSVEGENFCSNSSTCQELVHCSTSDDCEAFFGSGSRYRCIAPDGCCGGHVCAPPCGVSGCPQNRICGTTCCDQQQRCENGVCTYYEPVICQNCGDCTACDVNTTTGQSSCNACSETCATQTLCNRAKTISNYQRLVFFLSGLGFQVSSEPRALILSRDRAQHRSVLETIYSHSSRIDATARLYFITDPTGSTDSFALIYENTTLLSIVKVNPKSGRVEPIMPDTGEAATGTSPLASPTDITIRPMFIGICSLILKGYDVYDAMQDLTGDDCTFVCEFIGCGALGTLCTALAAAACVGTGPGFPICMCAIESQCVIADIGCGVACDGHFCKDKCPTGQKSCDGHCVDVKTDPDHCGVCFNQCPEPRQCIDGTCQCPITCPPGTRLNPQTCECESSQIYCKCNNQCYSDSDIGLCNTECKVSLGCFDNNCRPAQPGECG